MSWKGKKKRRRKTRNKKRERERAREREREGGEGEEEGEKIAGGDSIIAMIPPLRELIGSQDLIRSTLRG
jgi:hypothetical protein